MNQEKFERFILKKQSVLNHMNGTWWKQRMF
jgi:hypothetical protein